MKDFKMAELKFEAPLANFETEDWLDFTEFQSSEDVANSNRKDCSVVSKNLPERPNSSLDNFSETFSGSLEDLVNTFDEKITECFKNYEENTENFAPVQVRTQEELMNECPMWWTITGNYGNILPIDWSKSYTRSLHMPTLNLCEPRRDDPADTLDIPDDEELGQQLDMHSMIISSLQQEPMVTADDVIEELDSIMQDSHTDSDSPSHGALYSSKTSDVMGLSLSTSVEGELDDMIDCDKSVLEDRLQRYSISQLYELIEDIESKIAEYSETLVQELAHRDELEYEKELKNQFISLLLSIQNKRRQLSVQQKHRKLQGKGGVGGGGANPTANGTVPGTYLTTVIPYHLGQGPPSLHTLQILIKILLSINEDSSAVPALLTDYILKVLCPTST